MSLQNRRMLMGQNTYAKSEEPPIVKREPLDDESLYVGGEYALGRGP